MKLLVFGLFLFMIVGCASAPDVYVDKSLNAVNSASVYVYRPSGNWVGLAIDYRVYANGQYVGSVKSGKDVHFYLEKGQSEIKVSPYFMGMRDGAETSQKLSVVEGERLYFRFTTSVDGVVFVPGVAAMVTGSKNLQMVSESDWSEKNRN